MFSDYATPKEIWYNSLHMKTVIYVNGTDKVQDRRRLAGVTAHAQRHGWNLQSVEALQSSKQIKELIRIWRPDGFIVCRGAELNNVPTRCFGNIPVIFSHNPWQDGTAKENCIFSDAKATVELAAKELLSLNLTEYAFAGWFKPTGWSCQRLDLFKSLMAMHGRKIHVFEPSEHECSSNMLTPKLANWLATLPQPLGVLAANDQVAHRIVSACRLAHLSVPDDIAVIGIDNDEELCEGATTTISSIDPNFTFSGRLAGEALEKLMSHTLHIAPMHVTYPPLRLVRRESTRRFTKYDKDVAKAAERIRLEACNGLTANEVVKDFRCSRRMAEIRFRDLLGRSILQEIRRVRLETAQHLLRTSSAGIDFIANKCGYGSLSAFSIFFHNETGISPSAYRAQNRTIDYRLGEHRQRNDERGCFKNYSTATIFEREPVASFHVRR